MSFPTFVDERERYARAKAFLDAMKRHRPSLTPQQQKDLKQKALAGYIESAWAEMQEIVRKK